MRDEFSYPDRPEPEQDSTDGEQPLDIVGILFDYFSDQKMKWADRQEAVHAILGEEAEAIGNLLLNTPKPLTLPELATQSGLSESDADDACRTVKVLITESAPLEFVTTADREINALRYQIVPTTPRVL